MTDDQIVNEVRYCITHGVSGTRLQAALAALGLETRAQVPGFLERIRHCCFRDGCTRQEMADAFSDVGINPIDPAEALQELARRLQARLARMDGGTA